MIDVKNLQTRKYGIFAESTSNSPILYAQEDTLLAALAVFEAAIKEFPSVWWSLKRQAGVET